MSTVIIDYGSGNLHSARKAFERVAREQGHAGPILVSGDAEVVRKAGRIVLPGVGAFADCRRGLDAAAGMVEALTEAVRQRGAPFLGICVGMQLMATRGLEHETSRGLDWIAGDVTRIAPADPALKIPHMGWNDLEPRREHALLAHLDAAGAGRHAYFVHSYHLVCETGGDVIATAEYGGSVTAFVARDNFAGAQFHPEKSQQVGLALIRNFLAWRP